MIELQLLTATIMQRFEVTSVPGRVAEPVIAGTLKPKDGVFVYLKKRTLRKNAQPEQTPSRCPFAH
jgi:hypothetical protein